MYKGRVPGVAAEVEQWFASTFDPELVRRRGRARAPILVTPIPEVDELVPGVDALASGLCDALGRTVRGVTAARLLKRLRLPARCRRRRWASSTLYADEGMLARVSATTVIVAVAVDTRADLRGRARAGGGERRGAAFERVLLDALRRKDPGEANAPAGSSCCIIYISSRGELRYAGSHLIEKELWERHKNEFFELLRAGDARKLEALLRFLLKTRVNQHASTCRAGTAPDDMVDYFKEFKTSTEFKTKPARFAFYSKAGWSRAVFLHGVQYPAESRLIDVIGPDGDWFFNVNSAPVAGGNVWSFYVLDVDDVVRLSCHTLAATKKRVESWKRSTFKETMAKKPQHEKDAQQKQRQAAYLRGGCDQFGQKSIARSMGGAKAVKKRLVEKRAEMAAKRAAAAGLANPAAPRAPGAVVEEAPRRSSSLARRARVAAAPAPRRRAAVADGRADGAEAVRRHPRLAAARSAGRAGGLPAAPAAARRAPGRPASSAAAAPLAAAPAPPPRRSTRASAGAPASSAPLAPSSPRDRARHHRRRCLLRRGRR
ncbi:hypothetical protein JL720_16886 [Aureococcus anophagefferens]|nr:hypothetical protein JL720_16886 [Aureococcus anophagefferens]